MLKLQSCSELHFDGDGWGMQAGKLKRAMISIFKKALGSFTSDVDTLPEIFGAIHEGEEDICD